MVTQADHDKAECSHLGSNFSLKSGSQFKRRCKMHKLSLCFLPFPKRVHRNLCWGIMIKIRNYTCKVAEPIVRIAIETHFYQLHPDVLSIWKWVVTLAHNAFWPIIQWPSLLEWNVNLHTIVLFIYFLNMLQNSNSDWEKIAYFLWLSLGDMPFLIKLILEKYHVKLWEENKIKFL